MRQRIYLVYFQIITLLEYFSCQKLLKTLHLVYVNMDDVDRLKLYFTDGMETDKCFTDVC